MPSASTYHAGEPLNPSLAPSPILRGRDAFRWFAFLGILVCFWAIVEHRFTASNYYSEASLLDYDGTENRTADRIDVVNSGSSFARLALSILGFAALLVPSQFRFRWQSPVVWTMAGYFAWLFCTSIWSINPTLTIYKLVVVALFSAAALGISRHLTLLELTQMLSGACLVMMIVGVIAEMALGTFNPIGEYRFTGTTHPNTEATYASIVCLSAWTYAGENRKRRWLSAGAFSLAFILLILTKSRTSLAAMLIALVAMQALRLRGGKRLMFLTAILLASGIGLTTISFVGRQFQNDLSSAAAMGRTEDLGSLTGRLPLWEFLLEKVNDSPLIGQGYLAFWDSERIEFLSDLFNWEIPHGHNMYIDVLLDGGLVGLLLFVSMYLVGIVVSARYYLRTGEPGATILFGILVFAAIHGCTESLFKMFGFSSFVMISMLLRMAWVDPSRRDDPQHVAWIPDFPRTSPLPSVANRANAVQP